MLLWISLAIYKIAFKLMKGNLENTILLTDRFEIIKTRDEGVWLKLASQSFDFFFIQMWRNI